MDLSDARIELATDSPRCRQARTVLAEEVARRAQQVWPAAAGRGPEIVLRDAATATKYGENYTYPVSRLDVVMGN